MSVPLHCPGPQESFLRRLLRRAVFALIVVMAVIAAPVFWLLIRVRYCWEGEPIRCLLCDYSVIWFIVLPIFLSFSAGGLAAFAAQLLPAESKLFQLKKLLLAVMVSVIVLFVFATMFWGLSSQY